MRLPLHAITRLKKLLHIRGSFIVKNSIIKAKNTIKKNTKKLLTLSFQDDILHFADALREQKTGN